VKSALSVHLVRAGAVLALLCAACGYSTGLRVAEHSGHTIGIEYFDNRTPERDIEREFHAELSRAVIDLVHTPLVSPENADVVIRGTMIRFSRRGGVRSIDNQLQESAVQIQVSAGLWRRRRPGEDPPPLETQQSRRDGPRLDYDNRRGLTYQRDFTDQPVLGTPDNSNWIEIETAWAAPPSVGYIVGEFGTEEEARQRALRNAADRLVLDLFSSMN
jgi:hypothetical protein